MSGCDIVYLTDGYAPFLSMTSRETFLNVSDHVVAAPGPGHYDPQGAQDFVQVSTLCVCIFITYLPVYLVDITHRTNKRPIYVVCLQYVGVKLRDYVFQRIIGM
jgi:hypothetical protein